MPFYLKAYTDFSFKRNDVWHILLLICWSLFGIISVKHKNSIYKDVIFTSLYLRHLSLMMETKMVNEMFDYYSEYTKLNAKEDFIT